MHKANSAKPVQQRNYTLIIANRLHQAVLAPTRRRNKAIQTTLTLLIGYINAVSKRI